MHSCALSITEPQEVLTDPGGPDATMGDEEVLTDPGSHDATMGGDEDSPAGKIVPSSLPSEDVSFFSLFNPDHYPTSTIAAAQLFKFLIEPFPTDKFFR